MPEKKTKYLIIGGGLAGTLLSRTMEKYGQDFLLVDKPELSNASRIAGGMFNPVVFRRLQKSWMADQIIPFLHDFYPEFEKHLDEQFFYPRKLVKIMGSEEGEFWKSKVDENPYISKEIKEYFPQEEIAHPDGAGEVAYAGNVDIAIMINSWHSHLNEKGLLIPEKFDFDSLEISKNSIRWKNVEAEKIIFADGWLVEHNPYFNFIPLKPTKGEVLTIEVPGFSSDYIINKKIWMLPVGKNRFRVGSTYRWDDLNEIPREQTKAEILEILEKYLKLPYEVKDHQAGVRPTVGDRRPLLGKHPGYENLLIFNGLGTKGVMLGPWFADHFLQHLEQGKELMPVVNVRRFQRRWFKKKSQNSNSKFQ